MKRLAERNFVILAFSVTVLVMIVVRVAVFQITASLMDTSQKVEHTRAVLLELHAVLSTLQDAETGTRGFVITGQDRFLEPFNTALRDEPIHLARLKELLRHEPQRLAAINEAEALANRKIEQATKDVEQRRENGFEPAQALVSTGTGKQIMDEFRAKIRAQEDDENAILAGNVAASAANRTKSLTSFVGVTVFDFAVIAAAFYLLWRYISERDRAKDSLLVASAFQRAILDNTNSAVIASDRSGVVTHFNPAAEALLGYSAAEIVGKKTPAIWHDEEEVAERAAELSRELGRTIEPGFEVFSAKPSAGIPEQREWTLIRSDGQQVPVLLSVASVVSPDGEVQGFCGIALDISQRRRAEQALRDARDAAEAASRTKSQFLANMSHELRTPLNAIIGYSEMLAEDAQSAGQTQAVDDLRKINRAGKQLLALINDVLDLSKVEAGKMTLHVETFSVPLLVQEVVNTIRPMLVANSNRLTVEVQPHLTDMRGDLPKVRQVLLNLLSNASKFTPGGAIEFSVTEEDRPHGTGKLPGRVVCFAVRDRGIGMSPEEIEKLFQAFVQADASTSRRFGGTGLGLAISREFCQMMGGDIEVKSSAGEGSTFTVCLPQTAHGPAGEADASNGNETATLAATESSSLSSESRRPTSADGGEEDDDDTGGTVLVIDDDPAVQDLLRRMLEPDGYHVVLATSGDHALALARELSPIAITLDVIMPGMNGWSVLSALKADPRTKSIPVIMLSILDDRKTGYALGATSILNKPVDRAELIRALEPFRGEPRRSVLVIEDDPPTAELLMRMLSDDGWDARHAANGQAGLAAMQEQRPALVLLDLMMPLMDGFEFAAALRQNPAWRDIPVIVLTAKELTEDDRSRLNGDVQKILQKAALGPSEILREVKNTILKRRNSDSGGTRP